MKVKLSTRLENDYGNIDWKQLTIGESNAQVYQSDQWILKTQRKSNQGNLFEEKSRIEWLQGKILVPDIIDYDVDETDEYLIMSRLIGKDAAQTKWRITDPERLVTQLGYALRRLHDHVSIIDCPFDMRLAHQFKFNVDLKQKLDELMNIAPEQEEDLVFTHGDYCLPNIILNEEHCDVIGFVDLGRAGIADRYYDIALCLRSIQYNIGDGFSETFRRAYSLSSNWDENKIAFYQMFEDLR